MRDSAVRIVNVFPELLGTYGDTGNVIVLERRLSWRGLPVEVVTTSVNDPLPTQADLYVFGGGEDVAQDRALEALRGSTFLQTVEAGAHVFAVCAGLQLLGTSFTGTDRITREGLGLLDAVTDRITPRVVGEVRAEVLDAHLPLLNGFANHGGGTVLGGAARPFARLTSGRGNDGSTDGYDGAVQGTVIATYLHGPVLARNPAVADWLLARLLRSPLGPLPAGPPEALQAQRIGG